MLAAAISEIHELLMSILHTVRPPSWPLKFNSTSGSWVM